MNLENKVIYQIYPKSFLDTSQNGYGDLQGIISKLDYLAGLGVDYLWLSPINKSPQNDNGYDISDYDAIDERFGTLEDYQELIQKANGMGIKIMMDLVLNHTSTEHEWFKKAVQGDAYYQDFYIFRDSPTTLKSIFGGSAWNYVESLNKYYLCYFDKTQADLNFDNVHVRQELYAMVNRWIDMGVEGFRLDVIDHISKDLDHDIPCNGPMFQIYLEELNQSTFKDKLLTVGECYGASLTQMEQMCHSKGLFQAFHFTDITLTNQKFKWDQAPFDLNKLVSIYDVWQNQYQGCNALVMNNHDVPRLMSLWLNDTQYRYQSATMLITLYSLLKGNLYIFQGEEIGMTNAYVEDIAKYDDIETLNAFQEMLDRNDTLELAMSKVKLISRDNVRTPMQWNDQDNAGFSKAEPWLALNRNYLDINVEKDLASDQSIYHYYQKMIAFRKSHYQEISQKADFMSVDNDLLIVKRDAFTVICNFSDKVIDYVYTHDVIMSNDKLVDNQVLPYQVIVIK